MSGCAGKSVEKDSADKQVRASERGKAPSPVSHDSILALQRAAGNRAVTELLARSSGRPLDSTTREEMEAKFGEDFREVRVHTGNEAAGTAQTVNAKAYAFGRDIVFSEGLYAPDTTGGKRLLAHELAHVVQQSRHSGARSGRAETASLEAAAEQAADASLHGASQVQVSGAAAPGVARDPKDEDEKLLAKGRKIRAKDVRSRAVEIKMRELKEEVESGIRSPETELLEKDIGRDQLVEIAEGKTTPGKADVEVHHKTKLSEAPEWGMNPENLEALEKKAHRRGAHANDFRAERGGGVGDPNFEENLGMSGDKRRLVDSKTGRPVPGQEAPQERNLTVEEQGEITARPKEQSFGEILDEQAVRNSPEDELIEKIDSESAQPIRTSNVTSSSQGEAATAASVGKKRVMAATRKRPIVRDVRLEGEPPRETSETPGTAAQKPTVEAPARTVPQAASETPAAPAPQATPEVSSAQELPSKVEPGTRVRVAEPETPAAPASQATPEVSSAQELPSEVEPGARVRVAEPETRVRVAEPETPSAFGPGETSEVEELAEGAGKLGRLGGTAGKALKVGGHVAGAAGAIWGTYQETKEGIKQGQSTGEALSGALGSTAGSFSASPAAVAANLANTGIKAVGAHLVEKAQKEHPNDPGKVKEIKDRVETVTGATQTLVEVLPSSTITQGVKAAGRSGWNLAHGDMKAMDKQAEGFERGEAGAPLMGLTMLTDLGASVAGGEDPEHALNRVAKMGEGTAVAKAGDYVGDQTYQFINKDLPEAAEFAKKDLNELKEKGKAKLSRAWNWIKS